MAYRLEWRLVGRASRPLDSGTLEEAFLDRASALQALNALLLLFPVRGRNEAEGYWWGRRSADADIEMRIVLRPGEAMDPEWGTSPQSGGSRQPVRTAPRPDSFRQRDRRALS